MLKNNISGFEKIISVLSYATFGTIGVIYLLLGAVAGKKPKSFTKYHIFMSIFLSFFLYVLSHIIVFVFNILGYIPFVKAVVATFTFFAGKEILSFAGFHFNPVTLSVTCLYLYLSLGAIFGKYSYLPFFTDVILRNTEQ